GYRRCFRRDRGRHRSREPACSCCDLLFLHGGPQLDRDARALARLARNRDRAAMLFDDLLDDRQAEAGAEALGAEEGLEHLRQDVARDATAGILDRDLEAVADQRGADGDAPLLRRVGDRLRRVLDQIDDNAAHLLGVDLDGTIGREVALQDDAGRKPLFAQQLVEPGIGRDRGAVQRFDARIVEQVADDAVAALDAALDPPQRAIEAHILGGYRLLDGKERVADGAQGIAQLMRHGRRELAERRQPFLAQQIALRRLERRRALLDAALQLDLDGDFRSDVAPGAAIAAESSARIEHRLAADADMDDAAVGQFALEAEIVERAPRREVGV